MDHAQPSTSSAVMSPGKRRRRAPLSVTEKTMVQNVFKYVFNEEQNKLDTNLYEKPNKRHCAQKTADILGIGTATVFNVLKDLKENVTPTPPQPPGPKLTFKDKMDDFTLSAIRRKVHDTKLKVTPVQTQVLCTFFEENPEVIRGYKRTPECIEVVQKKWKRITQKLNTIGPARDHRAWAKYLCDMKAKLKRKHIKWRQNSSGTGPVMCNADDFNEIKLRMLQVLRKYPAELQDSHESNQSHMAIDKTTAQDINNDNIGRKEFTNPTKESIDLLHNSPLDRRPEYVNENENDEFDTLGKHIAQQLRTMPLPVALETQEMLLSILKKQCLILLNEDCNTVDPLDKL